MKYTVLLLYPDYMGDGPEGTETYCAWVNVPWYKHNPLRAAHVAEELAREQAGKDLDCGPEIMQDFRVLFVCKGFQTDIKS